MDDALFKRKMVGDPLRGGGREVMGEAGNGAEAQPDRVVDAVPKARG